MNKQTPQKEVDNRESARLFAESKMPENWDRKDDYQVAIFYEHFYEFLMQKAMEEYASQFRQPKEKWISVEDRLPELSGEYLVYGRCTGEHYDTLDMAMFDNTDGLFRKAYQPTHWQPLPDAPNQ